MLLGKRPRAPMKRTTSMSEITFDLNTSTDAVIDPTNNNRERGINTNNNNNNYYYYNNNGEIDQIHSRGVLATLSPRIQRRHSGGNSDFVETPEFLRACSLCKRGLVPGRDIYMYRGDSAFCSLECRQHQMNQDEKKDKFFVSSKKQVVAAAAPSSGSQATTKGETVAAS